MFPAQMPEGNDNNVVVEQPFGKHFGERTFDLFGDRSTGALTDPAKNGQSVASPSPSSSARVGRRIHRSIACQSVNDTG